MLSIRLENDQKIYQFSTIKFISICDKFGRKEMKQLINDKLFRNKDCFYNYINGRNGMQRDDIFKLVEILKIPVTDLLEEKKGKETKEMKETVHVIEYSTLSDFSKSKIFETITCIEECIWAFFATFDVEEEYFEVLESLRRNAVAIPDDIFNELESFAYCELDNLISNPDIIFEQLPPISKTIEGIRARNKKLLEIQDSFMEEYYLPLQKHIKEFIIR